MRFWARVFIVAYQVNILLSIGTDIATGRANETTLYKGISLAWASLALFQLIANGELWEVIEDIINDTRGIIKNLQQKNQIDAIMREAKNGKNRIIN